MRFIYNLSPLSSPGFLPLILTAKALFSLHILFLSYSIRSFQTNCKGFPAIHHAAHHPRSRRGLDPRGRPSFHLHSHLHSHFHLFSPSCNLQCLRCPTVCLKNLQFSPFLATYSSKVLDTNLLFSPGCSMPVSPPNKPK